MTLRLSLLSRPCTIELVADGPADDYGSATPVITTVETVCEFQQRSRNETDTGLVEVGIETWLAVFSPGTDLTTYDRLVVDGLRYVLVGQPWSVRHPITGAISHVEATVQRGP